jgi:hypothetical protein
MSQQLPADFEYLKEMYSDAYYPTFLVDKIKDLIQQVVAFIEQGGHSKEEIQQAFDSMTLGINALEDAFYEEDSELETVARESIGATVQDILTHFNIDINVEEAIREREW